MHIPKLILSLLPCLGSAADFIWVEGESSTSHNMRRHPWYDSVKKDSLSGNEWLSHFAGGTPPEAEFTMEVPESGEYHFWIRANPVARPVMSYRIGRTRWKELDLSQPVGNLNIASDGKPDMRFIAWINAGEVKLKKGTETIRFKFHSANNNHGAIDCFMFSMKSFVPNGALKPGQKTGRANPGFFPWEPDVDEFTGEALIDLSHLNEDVAGKRGRVRARGNDFILGNGEKVKFWAANVGPGINALDHSSHVYLAKTLAKRGVNMVRLHGAIYGSRDPAVNRKKLDNLHHMVWALKNEGIYSALSFYFPLWFHLDGDGRPFMLLFFDREMQKIYFNWADALLKTRNPYTRVSLGRDPAVAIVEVINEDSHFFWTFGKDRMPAKRWQDFCTQYGSWLARKYGSIAKAIEAWGGVREKGDDPDAGRMEMYGAWEMTRDGIKAHARKRKRVSDQVRFLTENMRGFYEQAAKYFREKCGYKGLVSCSNWHVTDGSLLDALERYCYTAGDVIDHHGYFDHGHKGENANWSVRKGHTFESVSALHLRQANPLPYVETEGYPHIISEIGWPAPNMYRSEFTFLTSCYGSLQGLDGIFNFAVGSAGWDKSLNKFPMNTPVTLGCFPAAALVYRRGDVQEAPAVLMENLKLEDLYDLKGSAAYVKGAFDQFRSADIPEGGQRRGAISGIDPLTFYVGRVARSFEGKPEESVQRSISSCIDRDGKTASSITSELGLDYGTGVATMNTERAQGATGFLKKKGTIRLDQVSLDIQNDYATVSIVSMDGKPIELSARILLQVMTLEQLYGFEATGLGSLSGRIVSTGSAPYGVEKIRGTVTLSLKGATPSRVTACDENGYATQKQVRTSGSASAFTITLNEDVVYYVIQR
jgi:hypothetical protein